jgi:hypothetical protein
MFLAGIMKGATHRFQKGPAGPKTGQYRFFWATFALGSGTYTGLSGRPSSSASGLVEAMRGRPLYSPRAGELEPDRPVDGLELVALARRVLDGQACRRLFAWARCRAEGRSFRIFCREMGWTRSTAYRENPRSLALVAEALNRAAGRAA